MVTEPDLRAACAEAFLEGMLTERARVTGLLELGRLSGSMRLALYAICNGVEVEDIEPEFLDDARAPYAGNLVLGAMASRRRCGVPSLAAKGGAS